MSMDHAAPASSPASLPEDRYLLRLYVAGATRRSVAAIQDVQRLCETRLPGRYILEIIDVHQQPGLARDDGVIATPTLVRQAPPPVRRLVGGFFADARVLSALGVPSSD
jgi:circadian clock protein KaiB